MQIFFLLFLFAYLHMPSLEYDATVACCAVQVSRSLICQILASTADKRFFAYLLHENPGYAE